MTRTIWLAKNNLGTTQVHEEAPPLLGDGEARLRVESFAVTANNVTYAVIGDMFGYWNFFPAEGEWGVVPMWGHAIVEQSKHPGLAAGARVHGYLPMGESFDVLPGDVSAGGFTDMAAHRQPMSPFYNRYSLLAADPEHDPAREDARMIFGPLFKTGFLIEAMFRRENWFGADTLIMSSASSKTALALAHCAKESSPSIRRVGLTSRGNLEFVRGTGLYDEVLDYANLLPLPENSAVFVDFAGDSQVLRAVHETLGERLKYSCLVGATHVEGRGGSGDPVPGPTPTLFFAPSEAGAAIEALGPRGFAEAVGRSWQSFVTATDDFISVDHRNGLEAARDAFLQTLAGKVDPATGIVIRP